MLLWRQCCARQTSTALSCQLWFAMCLIPSFYLRGTSFLPERKWKCLSLSCVWLCESMTVARQAPRSMEFSRQEYWSGLPYSRRSSQSRDRTPVSCIAGRMLITAWATREALPSRLCLKETVTLCLCSVPLVIPWAGFPVLGLSQDSSQQASGSFGKMASWSSPWTSKDSIDTYANETPSHGPCFSILLGASLHSNEHLILIACVYGSIVHRVFFLFVCNTSSQQYLKLPKPAHFLLWTLACVWWALRFLTIYFLHMTGNEARKMDGNSREGGSTRDSGPIKVVYSVWGQYESNEFLIYSVCNTFISLIKSIIVRSVISQFSTSAQTKTNLELFRRKKKYCSHCQGSSCQKNCLISACLTHLPSQEPG